MPIGGNLCFIVDEGMGERMDRVVRINKGEVVSKQPQSPGWLYEVVKI